MTITRSPAVAGMFYPGSPAVLAATVDQLLAAAPTTEALQPKALIVPHAGYVYSGSTAAMAYAALAPWQSTIRRVVLLGPTHRVAVDGIAVPKTDAFATPLGAIPLDGAAIARLAALPQIVCSDRAHAEEHSLEVHLPFLQRLLDEFTLVPLAVGHAPPEAVAEVLGLLWGGPETLIVISSDLSHYQDYQTAQRMDRETSRAIEALRFEDIGYEQACGRNPVNGLLWVARRKNLHVETIDLRNSGDTAGPRDQVVGYGAYVCH